MNRSSIILIAAVCHAANMAWCQQNGDNSQKPWDQAEEWQKESAIKGVEFRLANPQAPESAQHDAWMQDKIADGWVFGEVKDPEAKTHPCIVPFEQLPEHQQMKDKLFCAIVDALNPDTEVFNTAGLVGFGNYLLSPKRHLAFTEKEPFSAHNYESAVQERASVVYDADIQNWKEYRKQPPETVEA